MKAVFVIVALLVATPAWAQNPMKDFEDNDLLHLATKQVRAMSRDQLNAFREVIVHCGRPHSNEWVSRECSVVAYRYHVEFKGDDAVDRIISAMTAGWRMVDYAMKERDRSKDATKQDQLTKDYLDKMRSVQYFVGILEEATLWRYRALREAEGRKPAP